MEERIKELECENEELQEKIQQLRKKSVDDAVLAKRTMDNANYLIDLAVQMIKGEVIFKAQE